MKSTKKISLLLVVIVVLSMALSFSAFAAEDNFPYSFTMKKNCANNYCGDSRYRDSDKTNNPWMVNMTYNAEGTSAIAIYWLASSGITRTQYSDVVNVICGNGKYYKGVYNNAYHKNTDLGVRNNNNVATAYVVSGYWDEETGTLL
ncbi:MAG: DUF2712 domain-containing protein [Oscillospiraceae bacterium]|nr:DUF2712 domain-containing protein [Candidatus Limimonas egerieequi]